MTNDIVNVGVVEVGTENGTVRVYDKERMLIELFRLKSKFTQNYYKEAVNACRELAKEEDVDFRILLAYCKCFKRGHILKARITEIFYENDRRNDLAVSLGFLLFRKERHS